MKLEHFNWFPCHAHSWGVSLVQLLAFFTWWKNKNVKCQRRAADEKWISDSGGVLLCVTVCSESWVKGKASCCSVPFPTSPLKHIPVSLVLLLIPELGLEGRAGEQRGLFYPKPALLTPTTVKCIKVCCFWITSSVFLFLPEVGFWLLQLPGGPMLRVLTQPMPWSTVFLQFLYLCCSLQWREGASQISMRMALVIN